MSITLGRIGTDGITFTEAMQFQMSGDDLNVTGTQRSLSNLNDWVAFRDQLRGLSNNLDEPVVPFTSTNDSSLNGYYRINSTSCVTDPNAQHGFWMQWSVSMTRVTDYRLPGIESRLISAHRSFPTGLGVSPNSWWAVPTHVTETGLGGASLTRAVDDSTNTVNVWTSSVTGLQPYSLGASHWYEGGCKAEYLYGSNYRQIVGRSIQQDQTTSVRFGNGIIRCTLAGSSAAQLNTSVFYSGSYSTPKVWDLVVSGASSAVWTSVSLVTNSTHLQRWRAVASVPIGGGAGFPFWVDVAIRRGAPFIEIAITDTADASTNIGIKRDTSEAGTNITDGIRATSNDGDTHRYIIASGGGYATNTTVGQLTSTSGGSPFPLMLGYELAGSGAAVGNRATDIVSAWAAPVGESVTFVGR